VNGFRGILGSGESGQKTGTREDGDGRLRHVGERGHSQSNLQAGRAARMEIQPLFQCESNLERHLIAVDFTVVDVTAHLHDLEPAEIA